MVARVWVLFQEPSSFLTSPPSAYSRACVLVVGWVGGRARGGLMGARMMESRAIARGGSRSGGRCGRLIATMLANVF